MAATKQSKLHLRSRLSSIAGHLVLTMLVLDVTNQSPGEDGPAHRLHLPNPFKAEENRIQAVLQIDGVFETSEVGNSGYMDLRVSKTPTDGPAANAVCDTPGEGTGLRKGDIIWSFCNISPSSFRDRREFLDALNNAYASSKSEIILHVKRGDDAANHFRIRPTLIKMEVPASSVPYDFQEELNSVKPDDLQWKRVPTVPPTVGP